MSSSSLQPPASSLRVLLVIFVYELKALARDRRAILFGFLVPLILYPVAFLILSGSRRTAEKTQESRTYRMAVHLEDAELREVLVQSGRFEITDSETPKEDVRGRVADVAVMQKDFSALSLIFDPARPDSLEAHGKALQLLNEFAESRVKSRLESMNIPADVLDRFTYVTEDVASASHKAGRGFSVLISFAMVVIVVSTASFSSLDLFAGHKERGTLETLLIQPATPFQVLVGKALVTVFFAYAGSVLNLASFMVCSALGIVPGSLSSAAIPFRFYVWVLVMLFPFTGLIASLLVSVSARARSYREAQNTVLPLCLLLLLPVALAHLPGVRLASVFCLVPVTNMALAVKEVLLETGHWAFLLLALASNLFWAGVFLYWARRHLRESSLFPAASWDSGRQRSERTFLFAGGLLLLVYYVGTLVQAADLKWGLLATLYGLVLIPGLGYARWQNLDRKVDLGLRMPAASSAWVLVLLPLPLAILTHGLLRIQQVFLPFPEGLEEAFKELIQSGNMTSWQQVFLLCLSPALCEEFLFRGVILGDCRKSMSGPRAILWSAVLFGAVHLSIHRWFTASALGVVLGLWALRSGSILPGMVCHALFNLILLFEPDWVTVAGERPQALVLSGVAVVLVWMMGGRRRS